jgi:hypothetical protein
VYCLTLVGERKWFLRKLKKKRRKKNCKTIIGTEKAFEAVYEPSHLCASFQINTAEAKKKKNTSTAAAFVVVVSHTRKVSYARFSPFCQADTFYSYFFPKKKKSFLTEKTLRQEG